MPRAFAPGNGSERNDSSAPTTPGSKDEKSNSTPGPPTIEKGDATEDGGGDIVETRDETVVRDESGQVRGGEKRHGSSPGTNQTVVRDDSGDVVGGEKEHGINKNAPGDTGGDTSTGNEGDGNDGDGDNGSQNSGGRQTYDDIVSEETKNQTESGIPGDLAGDKVSPDPTTSNSPGQTSEVQTPTEEANLSFLAFVVVAVYAAYTLSSGEA